MKTDRTTLAGLSNLAHRFRDTIWSCGQGVEFIGSRHPEKAAGLIYLDAGYSYALHDRSRGDILIDSLELQKKLRQLHPGQAPQQQKPLVQQLLQTTLPQVEKDLQVYQKELQSMPAEAADVTRTGAQVSAFQNGVPAACQSLRLFLE